jgi:hypothetical protein
LRRWEKQVSDDRLTRAMRASGAPSRDPGFALSVLERAEKERFQRARVRAALRGGGIAATAAAGLFLLGVWASAHAASVADGAVWTAGLVATAWLARGVIRRLRRAT